MTPYHHRLSRSLFLVLLVHLTAALPALAAESVLVRGNLEIPRDREVADVVVADGNLRIQGTVLGSVYVAAGDLLLDPGAQVQGSLTVFGGNAWLSRGAHVSGDVNVFAGKAHVEEGAVIVGQVRVVEKAPSLTPEKIALVSRYLLLPRAVPKESFSLEQLDQLDLAGLHFRKVSSEKVANLDLGRLGKVPLDFRDMQDSREVRAEGRGVVRISMVKFSNPAAAERFWDSLQEFVENAPRTAEPSRPGQPRPGHPAQTRGEHSRFGEIRNSVHSSLGDGAQWYFRYNGSSYLLWTRSQYLVAIQSGWFHDAPDLGREEWRRVEETRDQVRRLLEDLFQQTNQP